MSTSPRFLTSSTTTPLRLASLVADSQGKAYLSTLTGEWDNEKLRAHVKPFYNSVEIARMLEVTKWDVVKFKDLWRDGRFVYANNVNDTEVLKLGFAHLWNVSEKVRVKEARVSTGDRRPTTIPPYVTSLLLSHTSYSCRRTWRL